jgi:hypothetical protein
MLIGEGRGDVVQRLDKKYEILKASSIVLRKCDFPKLTEQQSQTGLKGRKHKKFMAN